MLQSIDQLVNNAQIASALPEMFSMNKVLYYYV